MSILGEILVQLLGESAVEAMSKNKKPRAPFPEGEGNASLGAVSLFFGALALLFSGLLFPATLDRSSFSDIGAPAIMLMAAAAFLSGLLAYRSGRKAARRSTQPLAVSST
jgi:hypothetical protein